MKILHLAIDDKFTPFAQDVFESAFPGSNEFRVIRIADATTRFVQPAANVRFVPQRYWFSRALDCDLREADCLVVHSMTRWFSRAVERAPRGLPVVWHGWGADYYGLLDGYADHLYLPLTEALLPTLNGVERTSVRDRARRAVRFVANGLLFRNWMQRTLKRVDVISMLPDEFVLLQRSQPGLHAVFHQLYCSSAEDSFSHGAKNMHGLDLLLGNSATPTNNHLDAFEQLRRLDLEGRDIVVPLSYGLADYADAVCAHGHRLFGTRFVPLRSYLSPAEYSERIAACGFVFMNHVRQQATGTVSLSLFKGAKVFLREENLLFPFYRSKGAHVHRFPDAFGPYADSTEDVFSPLTQKQRDENRRIIAEYWSKSRIVAETQRLQSVVGKT